MITVGVQAKHYRSWHHVIAVLEAMCATCMGMVDHISIQKLWEKVASVSGASALHTITQTHSINHSLYLSILP